MEQVSKIEQGKAAWPKACKTHETDLSKRGMLPANSKALHTCYC
jgi:hypothetical protein